jgi:ribosome-associated protein
MPLDITPTLALPDESISLRFIRSGGPGGQNVNKVASAVQLRFDPRLCPALSESVLARLRRLAGRRLTESGEIVIAAHRFRAQEQNRRDAYDRLGDLIRQALIEPKIRRATKPTRAAKQRRLENKTQRGRIKSLRKAVRNDD